MSEWISCSLEDLEAVERAAEETSSPLSATLIHFAANNCFVSIWREFNCGHYSRLKESEWVAFGEDQADEWCPECLPDEIKKGLIRADPLTLAQALSDLRDSRMYWDAYAAVIEAEEIVGGST